MALTIQVHIDTTTYTQVTTELGHIVLYSLCTPVKIKRQAGWVAEKGLHRAREEITTCTAVTDTVTGSRFATPVAADPPFAERSTRQQPRLRNFLFKGQLLKAHTNMQCYLGLPWPLLP